jgi:dTMP kinase
VFVTFEGPEGSGKTTQSRLLAEWLASENQSVVLTYEPGGTALGNAVRGILLDPNHRIAIEPRTEVLLFAAARAQLVDEVIRPALRQGSVVICDRYSDSTIAYQCGGRGLSVADVETVLDFATTGLMPELTFLLDLDVSAGLARKSTGPADRLERETPDFHERVRRAYRERADRFPNRIVVLDASRPVDELAAQIQNLVEKSLLFERVEPTKR